MKQLITLLSICMTLLATAQSERLLVVGEGLRGRDNPGLSGKKTVSLPFGRFLDVIDQTEERDVISKDGDMCDSYGYYWHQLEINNQYVWAYGKYLYGQVQNYTDYAFLSGGKKLLLSTAEYLGYGSSDSDGLTGCDEYTLYFFMEMGGDRIYPIIHNPDLSDGMNHFEALFDKRLLASTSGEGGGVDLENMKLLTGGEINLRFTNGYQEGSNETEFWITFDDKVFKVIRQEDSDTGY